MKVSESAGEYLEVLWLSQERGESFARINWIAKQLDVSPPSVVEMLTNLQKKGYVKYERRHGVRLSVKGRNKARQIIRYHRIIETLMKKTLNISIDEDVVCGLEHHMSDEFADALCILLNHPVECPHKNPVPRGKCCPDHAPHTLNPES